MRLSFVKGKPRVVLLLGCLLFLLPADALAGVPRDLVSELESVVEEGLGSDNPEARAWALRAKTLLGRSARSLLSDNQDNTDLLVRVFAGVGLLELGNRDGAGVLSGELNGAGAASRNRILNRYVRHLSERDQTRVLEAALEAATEASVVRDLVAYIALHGHGDVYELMERAARADAETRELYVNAAVASGRLEAVALARQLSRSGTPEVRLSAVSIAQQIPSDESRSLLEELIHDSDSAVAIAAALSLAPVGVTPAYERLAELANSGSPEQQIAALEAIRDGQPSLLELSVLTGMLEATEDANLRRRIYEAIGATASNEAYQLLVGMIEGTVYDDRVDGVAGLGYTGRASAAPMLGDVLLGGGGQDLRLTAAEALGHLEQSAANEFLLEALQRERGGAVKVAVIRALASAPSEEAMWPLAFQLSNDEEEVVEATLLTLRALGAVAIASQVENAAISHRNAQVRWTATLVLFSLDPEVGAIRLNQALDRPPEGFMADIDALPEGPRTEAYRRLVRHSNPDIRVVAISRILSDGESALPVLRELMEPATPSDIRQMVADTLTAFRDTADLPMFHELSETSHRTMRYQALEAIVELASPDSETLLRGLLDSTDLERRVMAVYGLWKMAAN